VQAVKEVEPTNHTLLIGSIYIKLVFSDSISSPIHISEMLDQDESENTANSQCDREDW
jgi:hypothetical protein